MLSIKHLSKSYVRGKPVLNDITLDIAARGITAIIGPSGTGKSTLIRCVNRLVDPTAGEILFRGVDLARLSGTPLRQARRRIGMVFQEYNLVERLSVMENVLCGRLGYVPVWRAWLRRFEDADIARAFALLETVGLADFATRRADQLSGGQRQRVGIARALSVGPELLVADEPVSALDVSIQAQIVNLLDELKQRLNLAMLFISHDIAVMDHLSDRIAIVYLGRIMEIGPTRALIDTPRHPYTEALLSAVPEPGVKRRERIVLAGDVPNPADPPSGCVFRTRCRHALPACAAEPPPLRPVGPGHHTACIRDDLFPSHAAPPARATDRKIPVSAGG